MNLYNSHTAYLCLGTNLGNKETNLSQAAGLIGELIGELDGYSGIYQSLSWGYKSKNEFYNQCLRVRSSLEAEDMLDKILEIERRMGRERTTADYSDRIIDIDILFIEGLIFESDQLVIPHPRIAERMFVLAPLAELAPQLIHPVMQRTIFELVDLCPDRSTVIRI